MFQELKTIINGILLEHLIFNEKNIIKYILKTFLFRRLKFWSTINNLSFIKDRLIVSSKVFYPMEKLILDMTKDFGVQIFIL